MLAPGENSQPKFAIPRKPANYASGVVFQNVWRLGDHTSWSRIPSCCPCPKPLVHHLGQGLRAFASTAKDGAPAMFTKECWSSFAHRLAAATIHSVREVARRAGVVKNTSLRWRHRFRRLDEDTLKQTLTGTSRSTRVSFWKAARASAGCQERRANGKTLCPPWR